MLEARIIINVSDADHSHHNGLSGYYLVPGRKPGEEFGLLVIYSPHEIQDVGGQRQVEHWPSATSIAIDVVGKNTDAASHTKGSPAGYEKWGVLLCEASPDIPRALLLALEEEKTFLNDNPPSHKWIRDRKTKMMMIVNTDNDGFNQQKQEMSDKINELRADFDLYCRKLVTKAEVSRAKLSLQKEDQRLVAEGDTLWAGNQLSKQNISELHKNACKRMGQEREWCYIPKQQVDCPGCGAKIGENILSCPSCHGWLDEGIEELRAMNPKKRKQKMYPEMLEAAASS